MLSGEKVILEVEAKGCTWRTEEGEGTGGGVFGERVLGRGPVRERVQLMKTACDGTLTNTVRGLNHLEAIQQSCLTPHEVRFTQKLGEAFLRLYNRGIAL